MKKSTRWFWAVVLAQAVFLTAWAGYHEWVRQHAPVVRLRAHPVDPQDLLRGDYMILRYDIGTMKEPAPPAGSASQNFANRDIWILLERRGEFHEVVRSSRERIEAGAGQLLVLGTGAAGQVEYGIEHYFVPEGKGSPRFTRIEVEASVSPAHRLYIRRVFLDGKTYP